MSRRTLILVLGVAALVIALVPVIRGPALPADPVRVTHTVREMASAVEKRDVRELMAHVSASYKDAMGFDRNRLRLLAADALRETERLSVSVDVTKVDLRGDLATVELTASVAGTLKGGAELPEMTQPLRFFMAKEPARRLWVLPTTAWRVTGVEGYQSFLRLDDLF